MADAYTDEIQKRLDALPEDIRKLVYSADMEAVMRQIGGKHQLHVDQISGLEAEAVAVMMGMTKPEEFAENVADSLRVDPEKAAALVKDVNDQLFVKIREAMKKIPEPEPAAVPPNSASVATPTAPKPALSLTQMPAIVPPPKLPVISAADIVLTEKTVTKPASRDELLASSQTKADTKPAVPAPSTGSTPSTNSGQASSPQAKQAPPQPAPYKADPYREPVE